MRIYKYALEITDEQTLSLPTNAKILTVQVQHEIPQLWALFDETLGGLEPRKILIVGTGNPMPSCGRYIATFQTMGGQFVGHVFEDN